MGKSNITQINKFYKDSNFSNTELGRINNSYYEDLILEEAIRTNNCEVLNTYSDCFYNKALFDLYRTNQQILFDVAVGNIFTITLKHIFDSNNINCKFNGSESANNGNTLKQEITPFVDNRPDLCIDFNSKQKFIEVKLDTWPPSEYKFRWRVSDIKKYFLNKTNKCDIMVIIQSFKYDQFIINYHKWQYIILTKDYVFHILPELDTETDKYNKQLKYVFTSADPNFLNKYLAKSNNELVYLIKQLQNQKENIMA